MTVLVTGAAGGIGSAVVDRLLTAGHHVIGVDRHAAPTRPGFTPLVGDLGSSESIARVTEAANGMSSALDALVHAAAVVELGDPRATTVTDFDAVMAVNVRAIWELTMAALPLLLKSDVRSVVVVGSTHPQTTKLRSFPYNVSKGAVSALVRALAVDLGLDSVRVNQVVPGFVATEMAQEWVAAQPDPEEMWRTIREAHALPYPPEPGDVARAVEFLASAQSRGITGTDLVVDSGRGALRR